MLRILPLLTALLLLTTPARADIFHTDTGDAIEAELIKKTKTDYRIRTLNGIIDLPIERVKKIEPSTPPWRLYEKEKRKYPDTPQGHYNLALWCEQKGLRLERTQHLEAAIAIDPDFAPARAALGYVKKSGKWSRPKSTHAPTPDDLEARRLIREQEKLVRDLITDWFLKVRAIHRGRLAVKGKRAADLFKKGRDQILAIQDPLAIPALTGVLSAGDENVRELLVESLARFSEDEATMNLTVVALLDPARRIRDRAAVELFQRKDDRVIDRFRAALHGDEEPLIRNASSALGILKADPAIEDLIAALSTQTRAPVTISRPVFLDSVYRTWGGYSRYPTPTRVLIYQPTSIGCLGAGSMIGTLSTTEIRTVSIYRTEVQEALIAITGQNFGFDREAWLKWLRTR